MKRVAILLAALLLTAAFPARSMPGGDARFTTADTDKDGFLGREEFKTAFPGLKPGAFDLIDADEDGRISAGEWRVFLSGHGASSHGSRHGASPGPSGQQPGEPGAPRDGGLPVLTPPGK